jgi:endonuclease YncB( thermonuclease family)
MTPAAVLACIVIGITDGDSLTARCETPAGMETIKVRLAEIDAPEKAQAWGNRSRQHLATLCFRQPADIQYQTVDRYGRIVGRVTCNGTDTSTEQVRSGLAWVFDRYVTDRSLYEVQAEARAARRGLWINADPLPPWEWRSAHRGTAK